MIIREKALILILIISTGIYPNVHPIGWETSISEEQGLTVESVSKSNKYVPGIWYLPSLSGINIEDIIVEFQAIEGGLVRLDKSSNYKRINGIDLTHSYLKINKTDYAGPLESQSLTLNANNEILELETAWEWGYTGENSVIAVIDTGIDFSHPSLIGKKVDEKSFVKEEFGYPADEEGDDLFGHGTSVSGLIAGNDPNHPEYRGVGYDAKLVNAKVANSDGFITSAGLLAALDWSGSLLDVDVLNLSLGEPEEGPLQDLLERMANAVVRNGKVIVSSSGNDGKNGKFSFEPFTIGSPGSAVEAISVGSVTSGGNLAQTSSEGPTTGWEVKPDFVAPGENLFVPRLLADYSNCETISCYRIMSGTSFATPLISGVMGLAVSALETHGLTRNPGIVKGIAHLNSESIGLPWYQGGSGLINVTKFVSSLVNETYTGIVLPKGDHHPQLTTIAAGEKSIIPITVIGNSLSTWSFQSSFGNGSDFIKIISSENPLGYSHVVNLEINPLKTTSLGIYNLNFSLINSVGELLHSSIKISVVEPADYRLLIDLIHTPWDSALGGSGTRLEGIFGQDTKDLIQIFRENNVWVDEIRTGQLNQELLERYDIIWLPSAFVSPNPYLNDREPLQSQKITNAELLALYHYKQNGGKFIIDFGGQTVIDGNYDSTSPDVQSLTSLLSLFGIRVLDGIFDGDVKTTSVNLDESFLNTDYQTTVGSIELLNGIPIISSNNSNQMIGYIGASNEMALVSNNRNWRDETRLTNFNLNGPYDFAKNAIKWILKGDRVTNIALENYGNQFTLHGELNDTIKENSFSIEIQSKSRSHELFDTIINGNQFSTSFMNSNDDTFTVILKIEGMKFIVDLEIDLQNPLIEIGPRNEISNTSGEIQSSWDIFFDDNDLIPVHNYLVSTNHPSDNVLIENVGEKYRVTALNSYLLENNISILVEVVDDVGNYNKMVYYLSQLLLADLAKDSSNQDWDSAIITTISVFVVLGIALIFNQYILKRRKNQIDL